MACCDSKLRDLIYPLQCYKSALACAMEKDEELTDKASKAIGDRNFRVQRHLGREKTPMPGTCGCGLYDHSVQSPEEIKSQQFKHAINGLRTLMELQEKELSSYQESLKLKKQKTCQ